MKYDAIGIKAEYKGTTANGAARYSLLFCEPSGMIRGPFTVAGFMMSYWGLRSGDTFGDRWEVETRTTKGGREVIHSIKRKGGAQ